MVSSPHEVPHRLIQEDPDLIARLAAALGTDFPKTKSVSVFTADATESRPVERRIDSVFKFETYQQGEFLVLVEVQRQKAAGKPSTWMYYQGYMQERHGIPAMLVVLCPSEKVADWAAGPHEIGTSFLPTALTKPLVLSPLNVPKVIDAQDAADDIPLAALSAVLHAAAPENDVIMRALATAMGGKGMETGYNVYAELVELGLGMSQAAQSWRTMMAVDLSFFRSETSQRLRAEGRAEARAEARRELARRIIAVLKSRNVPLTGEESDRILSCDDPAQLDSWFDRSLSVAAAAELFVDGE